MVTGTETTDELLAAVTARGDLADVFGLIDANLAIGLRGAWTRKSRRALHQAKAGVTILQSIVTPPFAAAAAEAEAELTLRAIVSKETA